MSWTALYSCLFGNVLPKTMRNNFRTHMITKAPGVNTAILCRMRGETRMRMRDPNATTSSLELTQMHLVTRTVMTNTKFQTQYQNQYQPQTWVASQFKFILNKLLCTRNLRRSYSNSSDSKKGIKKHRNDEINGLHHTTSSRLNTDTGTDSQSHLW